MPYSYKRKYGRYAKKKRTTTAVTRVNTRVLTAKPTLQYRDRRITYILSPGVSSNVCVNEIMRASTAGSRDKGEIRVVGVNYTGFIVPSTGSNHPHPKVDLVSTLYIPKSGADLMDITQDAESEYPRAINTDEFKVLKKYVYSGKTGPATEPVRWESIRIHHSFGYRGIKCTFGRSTATTLKDVPYTNPVYLNLMHLGKYDVDLITVDGTLRTWYYET